MLEVGDVDEALEFYGRLFEFGVRARTDDHALIWMGDQVPGAVQERRRRRSAGRPPPRVVSDRSAFARALDVAHGDRLDVLDPRGNRVEVVDYAECRFRKAPEVHEALALDGLTKSPTARRELAEAGLAPVDSS